MQDKYLLAALGILLVFVYAFGYQMHPGGTHRLTAHHGNHLILSLV
jgi:hypothetical protein